MKCADCCYCWKEEGESYPSCKWESRGPGDCPHCEVDDYEDDDEEGE